jgi:hypothetical protein
MTDTATKTLTIQLQNLLEAEPGLQQTLLSEQDAAQTAAVLVNAAQRHGLPLDADALQQAIDGIRRVKQLAQADPALQQDLAATKSAREASEVIQRAAQRQGVRLQAPGTQEGAALRDLDDAELEQAVGGDLIFLALLGVGVVSSVALGAVGVGGAWAIKEAFSKK